MRGLTFLLANLLPSVPSPSLSLSSPLSFSFSPPYPFFWNHSGNCIVVAPECLHTRTQAETFHFCARTYRLLVVYVQQGRLSHARHFLFVLFEGLLDFSFFFGRGEQIVVTLIVTRTLLCDKIPAFYFHPTIKDPSSDLKLGFLSLHVREHGSSEWNTWWNTLCTVYARIPGKCVKKFGYHPHIQFPATACDNLTICPGHGFTGLVLVFHHRDSGRLNTVSNSRSVADI